MAHPHARRYELDQLVEGHRIEAYLSLGSSHRHSQHATGFEWKRERHIPAANRLNIYGSNSVLLRFCGRLLWLTCNLNAIGFNIMPQQSPKTRRGCSPDVVFRNAPIRVYVVKSLPL